MENLIKCYCGHTTTCDCGPEEPKQECMITKIMQMDAEMAYDSIPKQDKIMERFIANAKQETLEEETIENKFKSLVTKWQQQQINYETLAEHYIDDQHNNKKFTYKAIATRDCWKELLMLMNTIKDEK